MLFRSNHKGNSSPREKDQSSGYFTINLIENNYKEKDKDKDMKDKSPINYHSSNYYSKGLNENQE